MWKTDLFTTLTIFAIVTSSTAKTVNNYKEDSNVNSINHYGYQNLVNSGINDTDSLSTKNRLQRLGYSTGYGTLNGYPGATGLSAYNPIKLDLGGVVLGTLVGIGAIIIIPKILQAFHGGYPTYGRSENDDGLYFDGIMSKIESILKQNNIDSTSCLQRAVCHYSKTSKANIHDGKQSQMDTMIDMITENPIVKYLLDGTAIKEAIDQGKLQSMDNCNRFYNSCPLNGDTFMEFFDGMFGGTSNTKSSKN